MDFLKILQDGLRQSWNWLDRAKGSRHSKPPWPRGGRPATQSKWHSSAVEGHQLCLRIQYWGGRSFKKSQLVRWFWQVGRKYRALETQPLLQQPRGPSSCCNSIKTGHALRRRFDELTFYRRCIVQRSLVSQPSQTLGLKGVPTKTASNILPLPLFLQTVAALTLTTSKLLPLSGLVTAVAASAVPAAKHVAAVAVSTASYRYRCFKNATAGTA